MHRFFAPDANRISATVQLPPDEGRHLARVLRLAAGDTVYVFDGRGHEHAAVVTDVDRERVTVRTGAAVVPTPEAGVRVRLAVALLKRRKLDEVVRDATMLGASVVTPLLTANTARPVNTQRQTARVRWTGIAVASAKQCGRAVVPHIDDPTTFERFVQTAPVDELRLLLVEPTAAADTGGTVSVRALSTARRPATATVAIGPEGGWTRAERNLAVDAGFRTVTLGMRTLRADAAPVAALSVLQFVWGDL